jgi:hypothetical protein
MSQETATYRRIQRRELHSSRSATAIVVAAIVVIALAYIATETVLALAGQSALLVSPTDMGGGIAGVAAVDTGILIASGVVVALVGLVLVIVAIAPGRRARRVIESENTAVVVDNEVIASALARHAARAGRVSPDNVRVSVSHRAATVDLTPASGMAVDKDAVLSAVQAELDTLGLSPALTPRVTISSHGKVGA